MAQRKVDHIANWLNKKPHKKTPKHHPWIIPFFPGENKAIELSLDLGEKKNPKGSEQAGA